MVTVDQKDMILIELSNQELVYFMLPPVVTLDQ